MNQTQIQRTAQIINVYRRLQPIAKKLHKIDEDYCNVSFTEEQEIRIAKRAHQLFMQAQEFAEVIGLHAYHQSDPRGASLYLIDDSMGHNNYNNGIAVY